MSSFSEREGDTGSCLRYRAAGTRKMEKEVWSHDLERTFANFQKSNSIQFST